MTSEQQTFWTVGEVSALTRVSVRTLHHYDQIGLLSPIDRTESGYRLYQNHDLARLWEILAYRELGLPLARIAEVLEADETVRKQLLAAQAVALNTQLAETKRQLQAISRLLRGEDMNSADAIRQIFQEFNPADYEAETQQRWGQTDAYRQSSERTARYGKAEWEQIKAEGDAINARAVALMDAGHLPDSPEALALAQAQRDYFARWFYDPSPSMMADLAQLWLSDERFAKNYNRVRAGLAEFLSAAVLHWAAEQQK